MDIKRIGIRKGDSCIVYSFTDYDLKIILNKEQIQLADIQEYTNYLLRKHNATEQDMIKNFKKGE
jgi:hypothetical protein